MIIIAKLQLFVNEYRAVISYKQLLFALDNIFTKANKPQPCRRKMPARLRLVGWICLPGSSSERGADLFDLLRLVLR